jgi:RNA polymerase sigma factor (sigma-70 family)
MTSRQETWFHQFLRRGRAPARGGPLPDEQLLERFVTQGDAAAFEAILLRHGPTVLGVCRRVLREPAAAEDAFQATFLVLVRKAGSLRRGALLANWLYGVAYRTALRARVEAAKRTAREQAAPARELADPLAEISVRELLAALDEELHRLSSRHRAPLIACYLEGKTRDVAARELGWSVATLGRRLEQGRRLLGGRLARRGLSLPSALLATLLPEGKAPAAVPGELTTATLTAIRQVAAGGTPVSARAAALSEGVLRAMSMNKIKLVVVFLVVGLLASGAGLLVYQAAAAVRAEDRPRAQAPKADAPPEDVPRRPFADPGLAGNGRAPARKAIPAEAIKHWTVAEVPLPRDRTDLGGGEEVDLWVDGKAWKHRGGVVVWHIKGEATVFPVVGTHSRMSVGFPDRDSQLSFEASHQPDEPSEGKTDKSLSRWLKEKMRDMPKRAHRPPAQPSPEEKPRRPELQAALKKLDGYRGGGPARLIEMDELSGKLLQAFQNPAERGRVYYELAHVHAQSGLHFPEKVREYSRMALELPLPPEPRFQLYVYWGDAHRVDRRSVPQAEKRRRAAVRYLEGLKLLLPYRLPQKAPELPAVMKLGVRPPDGDPADPAFLRQMQEYLREKDRHDKAWAARLRAEYIGRLVWEREVLAGQLVSLYHNDPAAWGEIRQMAAAVLGDRTAAEQLLEAVRSGKAWYNKAQGK